MMPNRSPRAILALSATLALTVSALAPTAVLARGPGGNADCAGDCTADQPQVQQQVRARDGAGSGAAQTVGTQASGNGRNANGNGRNADSGADAGWGQNANGQGQNAWQGAGKGPNDDGERGPGSCDQCDVEMGTLTEEQGAGLVFMANEEKLAHDVYTALAEQYGVRIFENIAASEAMHQQAVNVVLERYGIEDTAIDLPAGEFSDPMIASLYATLIEQGSASLDEAIAVGALIEETDIDDLESRMAVLEETAPDVHEMYSHLLAASRNHLAAFEGWL